MLPEARHDHLVVEEFDGELLVYDQLRDRAHSLNRTAALVWRHCDGQTSVADLARLLDGELELPADEDLVWLALDRLDKARLLREHLVRPAQVANISRRSVIRKLGLASGLVLLLPVVSSIDAPTVAMAQSPPPPPPPPPPPKADMCRYKVTNVLTADPCKNLGVHVASEGIDASVICFPCRAPATDAFGDCKNLVKIFIPDPLSKRPCNTEVTFVGPACGACPEVTGFTTTNPPTGWQAV
jgi:hypothetical protein